METKSHSFLASKHYFCWWMSLGVVLMSIFPNPAIHAQLPSGIPWSTPNGSILQPGQAFGTCHLTPLITDPNERYVFAVWDTRSPPANFSDLAGSTYVDLWMPQVYHHPGWTLTNLGNVFGTTVDGEGNIYLAAIGQTGWSAYNSIPGFGALGGYDSANPALPASVAAGGKVYKIDGVTGIPKVFATLPQQPLPSPEHGFYAPGLGQIAYDSLHHQLFVSNFEDGKIYRIDMNGAVIDHFDPKVADPGAPGRVSNAEMVWALALGPTGDQLYFSMSSTEVRSITLDSSTGAFASADTAEFIVNPQTLLPGLPARISDLAFATDGQELLVAMRNTTARFAEAYNHNSISFLYRRQPDGAYAVNRNIQVGDDREGYGGTAFGPLSVDPATGNVTGNDQMLWFSSADILDVLGPHGLEAVPASNLQQLAGGTAGFPSPINGSAGSNSAYTGHLGKIYAIDYDGNLTQDSKGSGGEIDIMGGGLEGSKSCLRINNVRRPCLTDGSGDVSVSFDFVNLTSGPIYHLFIFDLPAGVTTPNDHFFFPAGVPQNGTVSVGPIRFHNAPPGPLSFSISIHDADLAECCSSEVIIDIPDCNCGRILTDSNVCRTQQTPAHFDYTFSFENLFPGISTPHVFVVPISPANITLTPSVFAASPPLQYGAQLTGTTQIGGPGAISGQQVCLRFSTHDALFRECCAFDHCFTLGNCSADPWIDFDVAVVWRDSVGNTGSGHLVQLTADSAYFWFFSEDNVELAVKILDGRAINGHWWFFYGALSDVEYTILLTDKTTGASKSYFNPAGTLASVGDTAALPGSSATLTSTWGASTVHTSSTSACASGPNSLCLGGGRFELTVAWRDFTGASGSAQAIPLTQEAGYFWFFGADNVELVLKVLDGRHLNGHWWVFLGAMSNVEYTLTVRDTVTGAVKVYSNPAGTFASVADTETF